MAGVKAGHIVSKALSKLTQPVTKGHVAALSQVAAKSSELSQAEPRPFEEIPGPPGPYQWPILGTVLLMKPFTKFTGETLHKLLDSLFDKYGTIVRFHFGKPTVLTCNPDDIGVVFRSEGKYPLRPSLDIVTAYCERTGVKGGLAELQGEEWHILRSPLNKRLLRMDSAAYYLPSQNLVADEFIQTLATSSHPPDELSELFFRYTAESIGLVCFNARLGFFDKNLEMNKEASDFLQASKDEFKCVHHSLSGKSFAHKWYRNKTYRDFERAKFYLREVTRKHVEKAKEVMEDQKKAGTLDPDEPNLLLSLTMDKNLDTDDVLNMMETLYVAATDSTAKNLQVLFYNLARNPGVQEKLHDEVMSVLGPDGPLTEETLAKLPYLKACVKESFRLVPPTVAGTARILPTDVVLSGYRIPAGVQVMLGNPRICRDHFVESDKFIPDRWLRTCEDKRLQEGMPKMASIPFSHGPRNCIGRRFAEQEIYLAAAKVVQKLKIDVKPESFNTQFFYTLFVQPNKPISFVFTQR